MPKEGRDLDWETCVHNAKHAADALERHPIMGTHLSRRKAEAATRLGKDCAVLVTAMEEWLSNYTSGAAKGFQLHHHQGRAYGPRMVKIPLGSLEVCRKPIPEPAACPRLRWWSLLGTPHRDAAVPRPSN